jgi:predicted acylesterase/phospholipase RssA
LVLQGGGALGSYQAGVYEALASSEYLPDWVAGISIGSINAAIIAGNPPEHRVERLRDFWDGITATTKMWPAVPLNAATNAVEATDEADDENYFAVLDQAGNAAEAAAAEITGYNTYADRLEALDTRRKQS